jgi:hypothetical protein
VTGVWLWLIPVAMMLGIMVNAIALYRHLERRRWLAVGASVGVILFSGEVVVVATYNAYNAGRIDAYRQSAGEAEECGPDAPKVVPYHPGMTLCPWQSAIGVFELPERPPAPAAPADDKRL